MFLCTVDDLKKNGYLSKNDFSVIRKTTIVDYFSQMASDVIIVWPVSESDTPGIRVQLTETRVDAGENIAELQRILFVFHTNHVVLEGSEFRSVFAFINHPRD